MSTDDLNLAGRARDVAKYQTYGDIDNLLVALADRIESLEAERDAAFNEAQRQHEWGVGERAARAVAEARLARVTDDSMAERIAKAMRESWTDHGEHAESADAILATIRAVAADEPPNDLPTQEVAADEQEAGR